MKAAKIILPWVLAVMLPFGAAYGQSQNKGKIGTPDVEQPIDISADNLEVQQDKNLAVFSGNVIAVQGQIELRAVQLRVWYRPAGPSTAGGTGGDDGTIIRIDAIDQVFVSSASETAQGDLGIYDVPEQRLTLTGSVILTRGENVLRGNKLVMNMATRQSHISGSRVHGRFVPPKRKK
jgi:lipopolysaccharide export system protein LptA